MPAVQPEMFPDVQRLELDPEDGYACTVSVTVQVFPNGAGYLHFRSTREGKGHTWWEYAAPGTGPTSYVDSVAAVLDHALSRAIEPF